MKQTEQQLLERIFLPLADYPKSTKEQVRLNLVKEGFTEVAYSGKRKGFYCTTPPTP